MTSPLFPQSIAKGPLRGILLGLLTSAAMVPLTGRGDVLTWQNTGTADWVTPGNWSGGVAPTASNGALIDDGGTALLGSGASGTAASLILGASGTGILDINSGSLNVLGSVSTGQSAGGSGSIVIRGGGVLATSGIVAGAGTGSLSLDGGVLRAQSNNSDFLSNFQTGLITIGSGGASVDTNGNTIVINASLSGTGGLTKLGAGDLTLSGSSSYSGGTVLQQGTLRVGEFDAMGSGDLTINGGGIGNTGTDAADYINNNIVANADFSIDATGTGGAVEIFGNVDLGSAATRTITLTSAGLSCFGGTISGQGLTLLATGSSTQAMFCSDSSNTFTGTLTVGAGVQLELQKGSDAIAVSGDLLVQSGGSVMLEVSDQFATTSNVEVDGVLSEISSGTNTFNALTGSGTIVGNGFSGNPDTLVVNSGSFGGNISESNADGQALVKQGAGLLALSGSSSYTGGTVITSGTLRAENNDALGAGGVAVENTGVLRVTANHLLHTTNNAVTVQANGSAAYVKDFATSEALSDANTVISGSGASPVSAQILSGTASAATTITITANSTSPANNDAIRMSDVINLQSTGTGAFVFQLSYTGTASGQLGWLDGTNNWVNATAGNTGNNATAGMLDYQGSFASFVITYGNTPASYVGAWGIDVSSGSTSVWSVVNHGGDFAAVSAVPEPSSWIEVIFGLVATFILARSRFKAAYLTR